MGDRYILGQIRDVRIVDENDNQLGTSTEPLNIGAGDSPSIDAFERWRISNPVSKFQNKNIHDRNKHQWEEPIIGALIVYSGLAGGTFQVAETITGGTSGTVGTITAVDVGATTLTYTVLHNDFEDTETITGGTSSATAIVNSSNTGSDVYHDRNIAGIILQVGALDGDQSVRTTHRYIPYVPGDSQLIGLTFRFSTATINRRKRVGYFDPDNGIYLEQTITGIRFVRRTKTSGSVVDNLIEQANWSEDSFSSSIGTNPSGITLDFTKQQFLIIDFIWQGSGRIRFGFFINGIIIYAHYENTSNKLIVPWMSTPSLPIRYEIINTAAATGIDTMNEFCSSVISEGGEKLTGIGYSISVDITPRTLTTEVPILAIRLKNSFGGGDNRRTVEFSNSGIYATSNAAHFEVRHIHDPSSITASWTDIGEGSAVEYSTDITAITGNPSHKIEEGYAGAGQAGKGGSENTINGEKLDQHRLLTQNVDSDNSELFVIFATSLTGTSNVYSHISWIEFE